MRKYERLRSWAVINNLLWSVYLNASYLFDPMLSFTKLNLWGNKNKSNSAVFCTPVIIVILAILNFICYDDVCEIMLHCRVAVSPLRYHFQDALYDTVSFYKSLIQ